MTSLTVVIHGTPAPQGSKRHVGHGVMVESSAKVAPWRAVVTAATATAVGALDWRPNPFRAMSVSVVFTLTRPASHYRSGRHAHLLRDAAPEVPTGRPDVDKLVRSTLDALVDGGAIPDDARVVHLDAWKVYPGGHPDALDTAGAVLLLREW